jgi:hypothetical protein
MTTTAGGVTALGLDPIMLAYALHAVQAAIPITPAPSAYQLRAPPHPSTIRHYLGQLEQSHDLRARIDPLSQSGKAEPHV